MGSPRDNSRILVCGPIFPSIQVGGLPLALQDLARALEPFGWHVDLAITPDGLDLPTGTAPVTVVPQWTKRPWSWLPRVRFLPAPVRTLLQHALAGGGVARSQSAALFAIEALLSKHDYAAVIAFVPRAAPGVAHFMTSRHPSVLLVSLDGLASELQLARWLWMARLSARLGSGRLHPDMYCPVRPDRIATAVFGSGALQRAALRAGVPGAVARVIHFGVPAPPPLGAREPATGRLLWVGRLSSEKGLHVFLEAIAPLRQSHRVTLTAVCGDGPSSYRREIESLLAARGLQDYVSLVPAVPREALGGLYAKHDLLLFHSAFAEPVALVLMEAFGAGLPVVAPTPAVPNVLVEPDRTCICFDSDESSTVARAIARGLDDEPLRQRLRTAAHAKILSGFTLETMGRAYDDILRRATRSHDDR